MLNEMKKNKNKKVIVILGLLLLIGICVGGYYIANKKPIETKNQKEILFEKEIKNEEIEKLFEAIGGNMQTYQSSVTPLMLGNLSQFTDEQRLNLLLKFNYENMVGDLTDEMISKVSSNDKQSIQTFANPSYYKYLTRESIRKSLKEIFNRDVSDFLDRLGDCPFFVYIPSLDGYVLSMDCGGMYGPYALENFIYDYKETENEVTISVVYVFHDEQNNEYARYEDGKYKIVYESENDFKFTEENIKQFNRLEYQFKKNSNGKYYIYDVVNLAFSVDDNSDEVGGEEVGDSIATEKEGKVTTSDHITYDLEMVQDLTTVSYRLNDDFTVKLENISIDSNINQIGYKLYVNDQLIEEDKKWCAEQNQPCLLSVKLVGKTLLYRRQHAPERTDGYISFINDNGKVYHKTNTIWPNMMIAFGSSDHPSVQFKDNQFIIEMTRIDQGLIVYLPKYDLAMGNSCGQTLNNPTLDDVLNYNDIKEDYPINVTYTYTLQDDGTFDSNPIKVTTKTIADAYNEYFANYEHGSCLDKN